MAPAGRIERDNREEQERGRGEGAAVAEVGHGALVSPAGAGY